MKFPNTSKFSKIRKLPGTIMYTGDSDLETKIIHYRYTNATFDILDDIDNPSEKHSDMIVVEGFKDKEAILRLTSKFGIDTFFVEDIFNVTQRNKFEITKDQAFLVLKYAFLEDNHLEFRRIYFILKKGLVLLFSDYENNYVNHLLERIEHKEAMFTEYDESYIIYAIYDMIIDEQLEMARLFKIELEELEAIIMQSNKTLSHDLFSLHRNFVRLRNNNRSLIDYVSPKEIIKEDLFDKKLVPFVTDLQDHIYNLQEKLNTNIELCNSLITMYSTQISNRTNDVMKTLTIISVIFIPLSFLAGVFGMNFIKFDFLRNEYGLIIFTVFSIAIAIGMLVWFKTKKWL